MDEKNKGKWPLKIVYAGQVRCGSVSLATALDILDQGPTYHFVTSPMDTSWILWFWFYKHRKKLEKGEHVDFDTLFRELRCFSVLDAPVYFHWEQIFRQYPNVKVILNVRDSFDVWYQSVTRLYRTVLCAPFWFPIVSFLDNIHRVIYHGYNPSDLFRGILRRGIAKDYGGWDVLLNDKKLAERKYHERIEYIKSIVPKEQLLIFNVKQGWEPLCKFLDVDIPKDQPFPHKNKTHIMDYVHKARAQILKDFLLYKVVPCAILGALFILRMKWRKNVSK